MRQDWGSMAEQYLSEREELTLSIQLVDARHDPSALDKQLNEWLKFNGRPFVTVATKADKLSKNQLQKQLSVIKKTLSGGTILAYSSETGYGKDTLWDHIGTAIKNFKNNS
jgi:GTP-binding protein